MLKKKSQNKTKKMLTYPWEVQSLQLTWFAPHVSYNAQTTPSIAPRDRIVIDQHEPIQSNRRFSLWIYFLYFSLCSWSTWQAYVSIHLEDTICATALLHFNNRLIIFHLSLLHGPSLENEIKCKRNQRGHSTDTQRDNSQHRCISWESNGQNREYN